MSNAEAVHDPENFFRVLSFVGNTEKKAVLELLVEPGETVTARELNARFAGIQEPVGAIKYGSLNNLSQTINNSHVAAGSFSASDELRYSTWQTSKGSDTKVADAVAGHMLGISADYSVSLEKMLGKSSAPEGAKRSPEVRARLLSRLASLATGEVLSLAETSSDLSVKYRAVYSNIQAVHAHGFLNYETTELTGQAMRYRLVGDPDPQHSTLTQRGLRIKTQVHYAGMLSARAALGYALQEYDAEGVTTFAFEDIMQRVGHDYERDTETFRTALGLMLREGVVERLHKRADGTTKFSSISVDGLQREIADRVRFVTEGIRAGDVGVIGTGIERGKEILNNPALVTKLLTRGYNHSSSVTREAFEQRAAEIDALISSEPLTTKDIASLYTGSNLTKDGLYTVLARMRSNGRLAVEKNGNKVYWKQP